jgi:hypothetical protein
MEREKTKKYANSIIKAKHNFRPAKTLIFAMEIVENKY